MEKETANGTHADWRTSGVFLERIPLVLVCQKQGGILSKISRPSAGMPKKSPRGALYAFFFILWIYTMALSPKRCPKQGVSKGNRSPCLRTRKKLRKASQSEAKPQVGEMHQHAPGWQPSRNRFHRSLTFTGAKFGFYQCIESRYQPLVLKRSISREHETVMSRKRLGQSGSSAPSSWSIWTSNPAMGWLDASKPSSSGRIQPIQ